MNDSENLKPEELLTLLEEMQDQIEGYQKQLSLLPELKKKISAQQKEISKLSSEKKELLEDQEAWKWENDLLQSKLRSAEDAVKREKSDSHWSYHRIRELEEQVKELENRSVWQVLWKKIKPRKWNTGVTYYRHHSELWEAFQYYIVAIPLSLVIPVGFMWLIWYGFYN